MPILSSHATRKLPRLLLFGLLLLYALPGLFARDPWKTDDATGFGVMLTMARGTYLDWLMPNVAGASFAEKGPLFFWLGGGCIKLFGAFIGELLASRVIIFVAIYVLCWAIWYATFALARRPEAQPHDPIGGTAPGVLAYGRVIADTAMLILLGTLGLIGRLHETTAEVGAIAFVALGLYGLVSGLHRPKKGALLFAIALSGAFLTRGITVALPLLLAATFSFTLCKPLRFNLKIFSLFSLGVSLPLMLLWPVLLWQQGDTGQHYLLAWWQWNLDQFGFALSHLVTVGRTFLWFAWPAWLITLWALCSHAVSSHGISWRSPQIIMPLSFVLFFLVMAGCVSIPSDHYLLPVLPGLAVLAAFGLTHLKRGVVNAIDWFSVMIFSLLCIVAWFYWIAAITGFPLRAASNIARLAPGYHPTLVWGELIFALAVTVAWGWLIHWRISRRPKVLWRSVVLCCGGLTLSWALLMTLWMPWLNHTRTYREVAQELKTQLPVEPNCIQSMNLGLAQRASFFYFSGLRFTAIATHAPSTSCDFLLLQDGATPEVEAFLSQAGWQLHWEGRRAAGRNERFRLYQKYKAG